MKLIGKLVCSIATSALLSSCGVPTLYGAPTSANGVAPADEVLLAPKVADIVDEIACELGKAKNAHSFRDPYVITVLLTLQVEDNLDLTPSLSFIHPFAIVGHNRTFNVSADLGGARKRNFTTTYYLDSSRLNQAACSSKREQKKLYQLSGDLGLADIVRDGEGTIARETGVAHVPSDAGDKAIPTFGSLVQFVVTKALTGLGPVWTLTRFRGPSGVAGLVNGKRLNTDSITITFARKYTFASSAAQVAATAGKAKSLADKAAADRALAQTRLKAAQVKQDLRNRTSDYLSVLRSRSNLADRDRLSSGLKSLRSSADGLDRDVASAEAAVAETNRRVLDAEARLEAATAAAQAEAPAAATQAGQNLLTTMVLQNLNVQPR